MQSDRFAAHRLAPVTRQAFTHATHATGNALPSIGATFKAQSKRHAPTARAQVLTPTTAAVGAFALAACVVLHLVPLFV